MNLGTVTSLISLCAVAMTAAAGSAASQIETDPDATPIGGPGTIVGIHAGSCDERERDDLVTELAPFQAASGEHLGSDLAAPAVRSFTPAIPVSMDQLLVRPHVVDVRDSREQAEEPLACGEIAGGLTINDELVIGLGEENASGVTGIAYLVPSPADVSQTSISVFVAEDLIVATRNDREKRDPDADATHRPPDAQPSAEEAQGAAPAPLASWPLDDANGLTAVDASGHGFTGRYGEGVKCGISCGVQGTATQAPRFDGGGTAYVDMGDVLDFREQAPFSLEAWITPSRLPVGTFPRIVQKEGADANGRRQGYLLFLNSATGHVGFERWRDGVKEEALSRCPIPFNDPTHVVATYDGETMRLFVNGIEAAATPSSADLQDTPFSFRIGNSSEGTSPFDGTIDEVAVYDVALDADSVAARYGAGFGQPSASPGTPTPASPCL